MEKSGSVSGLADVAKYGTYKEFAFFDKVSCRKCQFLELICTHNAKPLSLLVICNIHREP